jgi:hypothetical protein
MVTISSEDVAKKNTVLNNSIIQRTSEEILVNIYNIRRG